jgi:tRNA A-37 threonylcarbamoyl transferase component Bud32/tetratricopeptide (TPR) repeat protein
MNRRVQEVFHEVVDLSPEARRKYFEEHGVEEEIRKEVEGLLAFDSGASAFLLRDIGSAAERAMAQLQAKGWRCGPYRLLELIGRGGMGAVYLAERADGEVRQRAAVKLLQPGADDPQHRERFLQERQILAGLSHPNIARLLDAGHREDGQPFLAMEHVEGQPIDVFAAELGLRQKIALFLKVCAAVSYLHRNLIVHRDLKPSNILVTPEGEPKLLDFGIAKLLDVTTDSTRTFMRMLTPDYASPEQVLGRTVSTATDIYSLGAVLYRLLTGKPPHQFDQGTPEAIASVICEREIARPSKWTPALKGDLDLILLKALHKKPPERYATAEQFAEDLENFLESRPIRARKGDFVYRARKFARRYWLPVAAMALMILGLSAGLFVANRERVIAQRRFSQLRQLSSRVMDLDGQIRNLPGSLEARHRLVSASLEYLEGLRPEAPRDLDLAQELADAYFRVARVQGVPTELNLGQFVQAEESLKKADALIETILASRPRSGRALHRSASIAQDRMILAQSERRQTEALAHARKAVERAEMYLRQGDPNEPGRSVAAVWFGNVSVAHVNMHLYEDGARSARRAVEIARAVPSARLHLGPGLSLLANALRFQGDLEAALQTIREAREISQRTVYPDDTWRMIDIYGVHLREGLILGEDGGVNLDRPAEAMAAFQRALDMTEEAARKNPNDQVSRGRVATSARELGNILRHRDPERALSVYDLASRRLGEIKNNLKSRRDQALVLANSSYALRRLHRLSEARQRIDAAFAILKETKDYPTERIALDSEVHTALRALADHQAEEGQTQRAIATYEQLLDKVLASKPEPLTDLRDAAKLSRLYEASAGLYRRAGQNGRAESMETRRLELWRHWDRKLPNNVFVRRQLAATAR